MIHLRALRYGGQVHVRAVVVMLLALWIASAQSEQAQPASSARERLERAYRASNRGVALLEQFDYPAAASAFREALQIEPTLATARLNLAIALLYAGQTDAALPEARAAASALSNAPQPPFVLGLIARADNRTDDAEAAFRRVLEIDRTDAAASVNLGQLLLQKRQFPEAVAAFRAAVDAEPYNATGAYGLAMALTRSGEAAAGQQQMTRFQTLRDSAYAVTYSQGYLQQGRYGEAIVSTGAEPALVDRTSPRVTFADGGAIGGGATEQAQADGGTLLFDADRDGDLDLLVTGAGTQLLRNDRGRFTRADGLPASQAPERRASAGDVDNDGRADLFIAGVTRSRLLHQRADGTFEDVTRAAGLPADFHPGAAAWVDVDHDGDVDLVTAAPLRLLRNNGNSTFADITRDAGLGSGEDATSGPAAVVPTDYDNRRDVDLLILGGGGAPRLFRNMRDGTFQEAAAAAGLPQVSGVSSAAAADVNKDGFIDFFFGRSGAPGVFALSDGREKFVVRPAPSSTTSSSLAQFVDYDNDGLLDLLAITADGSRLLRNLGEEWADESSKVTLGSSVRSLALGDVDGDGDTDIVAGTGQAGAHLWRNDGGSAHRAIAVTLAPRVSNRSGVGAKVEIRAGSLRQMLETTAASPAVGPADLLFGIGARDAADVVRVLWPSGILQTELGPGAKTRVEELDRKPSSCPYLYTWNGSRFEFVTDFLGGGEMGAWIAPRQYNTPDPDEYVRITGEQLRPRDGRYEIRVTNELEEALFLDRVRLVVVDHPADVEVYPNEGLRDTPPPFRLHATRGARVPERAIDEHGHDVRDLIARRDRRWPDDFARAPIRGHAAPHSLTLSLGADADRAVLLLTGWTAYAFSSDSVAASQAGLVLQPPVLEVKDATDRWVAVDTNVGFPVGRPQTVVVDLAGKWRGPSRDVRLSTSMAIYWDQVLVDTSGDTAPRSMTTLDPVGAALHWRGFSAETSPDGREPRGADYHAVSSTSPWKTFAGAYTREGDVRDLLRATDDMFVIAKPGDEIALSFDAAGAPPLRDGWRRTFLFYGDGFSKEMNIRSATPDSLGPLPFHGMTRYPLPDGEHYPRGEAHTRYLETHNTRIVPRSIPSIDAAALRRHP